MFNTIDKDKDGIISFDEVNSDTAIKSDDPEFAKKVFQNMDINKDEKVTLEEFITI